MRVQGALGPAVGTSPSTEDVVGCPGMLGDALPLPHPSPGSLEHLLRSLGKASIGSLPDGLPEPALTCPGELSWGHEHRGPPRPAGSPCVCSAPIRIRKDARILTVFSGLPPASRVVLVLKLSRRGWWPFCLALHPLGVSPLCFQLWRFSGTGQAALGLSLPSPGIRPHRGV